MCNPTANMLVPVSVRVCEVGVVPITSPHFRLFGRCLAFANSKTPKYKIPTGALPIHYVSGLLLSFGSQKKPAYIHQMYRTAVLHAYTNAIRALYTRTYTFNTQCP